MSETPKPSPDKSWSEKSLAERAASAMLSGDNWLSPRPDAPALRASPASIVPDPVSPPGADLASFLRVIGWLNLAGGVLVAIVIWANTTSGYGAAVSALNRAEILSGVAWAVEGVAGLAIMLAIEFVVESVGAIRRTVEKLIRGDDPSQAENNRASAPTADPA